MEPDRPSGLRDSVQSVTERIEEVLETAERVAGEIEADARAEADRQLREARSEADDYLGRRRAEADNRAVERRAELDATAAQLRQSQARIRDRAAALTREIDAALDLLTEPQGGTEARAAAAPAGDQSPPAEEALLRATQLAVAGSGRGEIEDRLRSEFDLIDPRAVVDEILGDAEAGSG